MKIIFSVEVRNEFPQFFKNVGDLSFMGQIFFHVCLYSVQEAMRAISDRFPINLKTLLAMMPRLAALLLQQMTNSG